MQKESLIQDEFRLTPTQKTALEKLKLRTVEDLLYYFPARYVHSADVKTIGTLTTGAMATVYGSIKKLKTGKTWKGRMPMAEAIITDGENSVRAVWFHQPYIAKMFVEGATVRIDGKVGKADKNGRFTIVNPKIEHAEGAAVMSDDSLFAEREMQTDASAAPKMYPIYPESRGITSNWMYHAVQKIFKSGLLDTITDPLPDTIIATYKLPGLKTALVWVHTPQKDSDATAARKRLAFEEVFYIQLRKRVDREKIAHLPSYIITQRDKLISQFTGNFPFQMTASQERSIADILADLRKGTPMSRLLEGDVGSGKTAVAATAVFATVTSAPGNAPHNHLQAAYMAPTEILAKQHFESFIQYFIEAQKKYKLTKPINIGLLTGSGCQKFPSKVSANASTLVSRAQLLKWVASGDIQILIGTHALIQKAVTFKHLALVVIDEQHRFGTAQRQKLAKKEGFAPHLLSMTATPIPRTLALTMYGDLDLSLLDQMPAGRKPIITEIITPNRRAYVYEKIRAEIAAGRQAYVICPRINEPDPDKEFAILAKSVAAEAARLRTEIFPGLVIAEMHSKMTPTEKDDTMARFSAGEIHILVSTSVVEVGVNVPNATNIIIEGAERFGLAQLHQLRGRVVRSNHQAYCYVFTDSRSEQTLARLKALVTARNGFELAEHDLKLRGAGELAGGVQWGISDLGMEAIKNIKMVEAARKEASALINADPTLTRFPLLKKKIAHADEIHFE